MKVKEKVIMQKVLSISCFGREWELRSEEITLNKNLSNSEIRDLITPSNKVIINYIRSQISEYQTETGTHNLLFYRKKSSTLMSFLFGVELTTELNALLKKKESTIELVNYLLKNEDSLTFN